MSIQTYSTMIVPNYNAIQYFDNVPNSKKFKIYTDKGKEVQGKCVTFFDDNKGDAQEIIKNASQILDVLDKKENINIFNEQGVEYTFEIERKLYFYAKNVEHPFKIYVDIEI